MSVSVCNLAPFLHGGTVLESMQRWVFMQVCLHGASAAAKHFSKDGECEINTTCLQRATGNSMVALLPQKNEGIPNPLTENCNCILRQSELMEKQCLRA